MQIDGLRQEQFRSFERAEAGFSPGVNLISGENAQGKTNLLEAVYLLARGRSFRTRLDRELIRFGSETGRLEGSVQARGRRFQLELELYQGKKKKFRVNGLDPRAMEMTDYFAVLCFTPEDLDLIRAGESARRRYLDEAIAPLRPKYAEALTRYRRAHEQKTRILREREQRPDLLDTLPEFNEVLAGCGARIIRYRAHFVERIRQPARQAQLELSGGREELELRYSTVSTVEDPFASEGEIRQRLSEHLRSHAAAELATGQCLSGPHKDALDIQINGRSVRTFGSQGQTRTAALALKLAELELVRSELNQLPVLLLDDVFSELDRKRQRCLMERVHGGQVIITCCRGEEDIGVDIARTIRIEGGKIL